MEKQNAKEWPKTKRAKFLTAGLVSYKDVDAGVALLKQATIMNGLDSFVGKPVIIDHSEVNPGNYERFRKGNVICAHFNPADGWFYVDFIVDDDTAVDLIENKGYSVSCAYNVLDVADGGLYQDIPYDGEITKISFTHLALVTDPRYEESKILDEMPLMMVNSKTLNSEGQIMFMKLFKKNAEGKQEAATVPVIVNGKEVQAELFIEQQEIKNEKGDMDKPQLYAAKDEDLIDVNGNTVRIGELKNAYLKSKENAKDDEDKEKDMKKEKENEKEDEQEKDVKKEEKKDKPEGAVEDEEKRAKENAKKKEEGDKFFAQLSDAENAKDKDISEGGFSPNFGLTRSERANNFRNRISKNIAGR